MPYSLAALVTSSSRSEEPVWATYRTLLRLAFSEMNLHRIHLRVDADNARGIRCYEKCGFRPEGTMRDAIFREGRYHDQLLMSVLRPEHNPEE